MQELFGWTVIPENSQKVEEAVKKHYETKTLVINDDLEHLLKAQHHLEKVIEKLRHK